MVVTQNFSIFVYGNEGVTTSSNLLFYFIFYTMTQKEFEDRIGRTTSTEEYAMADLIYLASDMDKDKFCNEYKKCSGSKLLQEITSKYYEKKHLYEDKENQCDHLTKELLVIAYREEDNKLRNRVRDIIGQACFVKFCLKYGYALDLQDGEFVLQRLNA